MFLSKRMRLRRIVIEISLPTLRNDNSDGKIFTNIPASGVLVFFIRVHP